MPLRSTRRTTTSSLTEPATASAVPPTTRYATTKAMTESRRCISRAREPPSLDGPTRTSFNLPLLLLAVYQIGAPIFDHPDHVD